MLNNIPLEKIVDNMNDITQQRLSLKINTKSIIDTNNVIGFEMKQYLSKLLGILESSIDNNFTSQTNLSNVDK